MANARRFQTRRLVHALVRHDIAMIDEPVRAQSISMVVGWLSAGMALIVAGVLALVVPPDTTGDAPIVMVRDSGALYVRVDHRLHPVANLASARLVAHAPTNPVAVTAAAIAVADRGPALGISGAPAHIGGTAHPTAWLVCDGDQTVVFADPPVPVGGPVAPVLVTPAGESSGVTYLLYDGKRAAVDLRDLSAVRALRLDGVVARPISRVLLELLPQSADIAAPVIGGLGGPAPIGLSVGQVLRLTRAGSTEYYVALRQGLQRIGEVAADLIRFRYGIGGGDMPSVAPDVIATAPVVNDLAVSDFPASSRTPIGGQAPKLCVQWHLDDSGSAVAEVRTDRPTTPATRSLAQSDGSGPRIDAVALPGGQSIYARAAGVGGDTTGGALYLIADSGVRYGIHDEQAASYLGLAGPPVSAPWPLLAQLPQGPELSVESAELPRDSTV